MTTTTQPQLQSATASMPRTAFAVLAVVFLGLSLITPYVLGAIGAYLQIICTLAMLAILAFERNGFVLKGDPTFKLLLVAFGLLALAFIVTARAPGDAALIANFAMLALFGPLSRFLARFARQENLRRVASFALAGSVLAFAVALYQVFAQQAMRAYGWGSDPIWSGEAALILGFLAGVGTTAATSRWRWLYLLGPVLGICTCLLSGSRGPMLAVPVLILITLSFSSRRWWLLLGAALLASVAVWLSLKVLWPVGFDRVNSTAGVLQDLVTGRTIAEVSGGTRQAFYSASYGAFMHSPWIGYGWADKMQAIIPYLTGDGAALVEPHRHLHSDLLDFAVSGGLVGLIAYGLILIAPILAAWRGPRDSQFKPRLIGTALLAAGYLLCGLTYLMLGFEFLTTLYVCLAAIFIGYCRDAPPAGIAQRE